MNNKLQQFLQENTKFDPRAAQIVCMRHGWCDYEKHTFAAIGKVFGISGTRVSQIQQKTFRVLRHPARRATMPPELAREIDKRKKK